MLFDKLLKNFIIIGCVLPFVSCGVMLNTNIVGKWKLDNAEFFVYNDTTDTYKSNRAKDKPNYQDDYPILGNFFFMSYDSVVKALYDKGTISAAEYALASASSVEYMMELAENGELIVTAKTKIPGVDESKTKLTIVNASKGDWSIDSYKNTLTIKVKRTDKDEFNFWYDGFKMEIDWPLSSEDTMELVIKDDDVDIDYIPVYYKNDVIKKSSRMKGIFKKQ